MERTRDIVLRLLDEHGECSVAELAEIIGVSTGSVRRHLDLMVADGLLEARIVRMPRGRPVTRYALSVAGEEERAAEHYQRLLSRLSPALAKMTPDEVGGQGGQAILDRLFDHVAESVADEYRPRVTSDRLDERVQQVLAALTEEGILHEAEDSGDFFTLKNAGCPYRSTAMETHACCAADRRTIELLLGTPVKQVMTVAEGGHQCEYVVPKAPGTPAGAAGAGHDLNETERDAAQAGGLLPVVAQKRTASQR
ncbi:MAG: winged helix-turn-helix transcriptional regulator [Dehalococcoidia bacterium]